MFFKCFWSQKFLLSKSTSDLFPNTIQGKQKAQRRKGKQATKSCRKKSASPLASETVNTVSHFAGQKCDGEELVSINQSVHAILSPTLCKCACAADTAVAQLWWCSWSWRFPLCVWSLCEACLSGFCAQPRWRPVRKSKDGINRHNLQENKQSKTWK